MLGCIGSQHATEYLPPPFDLSVPETVTPMQYLFYNPLGANGQIIRRYGRGLPQFEVARGRNGEGLRQRYHPTRFAFASGEWLELRNLRYPLFRKELQHDFGFGLDPSESLYFQAGPNRPVETWIDSEED